MPAKSETGILWIEELRKDDIPLVGGKNANLGELHGALGAPVPPGFCITAEVYRAFMEEAGLDKKVNKILKGLDASNLSVLLQASEDIRELIEKTPTPESISNKIVEAYEELARKCGKPDVLVAVRSSATAEDLPDASFAGQQDTFLNVGPEDLAEKVRACWSSLFTSRAIAYREEKGFRHEEPSESE